MVAMSSRLARLFWEAFDRAAFAVTDARLWLSELIHGTELLTLADEKREAATPSVLSHRFRQVHVRHGPVTYAGPRAAVIARLRASDAAPPPPAAPAHPLVPGTRRRPSRP